MSVIDEASSHGAALPGRSHAHRLLWAMAIGGVLACAAALRVWHLDARIPFALGIDEPQIMERAVRMMKTGDFNPHFFDWPSLTIYLNFVVAYVAFLAGAMRGEWSHLDQVDPSQMYLAGRSMTALLGTATVALVYLAGRRWGQLHAIVAAAVMAVIPYHVRESHYVLADVPTGFFTALALLLTLRATEQRTLASFTWAGVAVGLAGTTKYNGLVALVLPLLASWFTPGTVLARLQRSLVVCGAAIAAFFAGTPYALLDPPSFLNDYARVAAVFARDRPGEPGWSIYLKHLRLALGSPGWFAALTGLALALWSIVRGPHRLRWLLLAGFVLLYFRVMAASYQIYGRYLVPLFPFVSLLVAAGLLAVWHAIGARVRSPLLRQAVQALLVAAVMVPPTLGAIAFDRGLGQLSTMEMAYRWIEAHVPNGSTVVVERDALMLPRARYTVVRRRSLIERTHEQYVEDGVDYLIASSEGYRAAFDGASRPEYISYQTLFVLSDELATFSPGSENPGPELKIFGIRR